MNDMRVRFPGYVPERMRSGETRHRVRVAGQKGRRIRIPVGPDDPAFSEHYHAARAGHTLEDARPAPAVRGSLGELVRDYMIHLEAQVTAGHASPLTLRQRRSLLSRICDMPDDTGAGRMGDLHHDLPGAAIVHIIDQWGERTAQADNSRKALAAVYTWAIPRGRAAANPARGVRNVHKSRGGAVPWSTDDVRQFLKTHGEGSTARRWLFLATFTASRISDIVMLGRRHEVEHEGVPFLQWQPGKKGSAFVSIPIAPPLLVELRAAKVEGPTYLLNAYGQPFKNGATLNNRVQKWVREAKLTHRSQHGLRKAMGELMAEAGATQHQIMSVMAHTKPATSAIYTERADRRRMAIAAMESVKGIALKW